MMIHSTSVLPTVRDGATFPFDVAVLPTGGRPGAVVAGGELCTLPAPSERRQAAEALMAWLTEPAQQSRWGVESGYIAVRRSAWDLEPLRSDIRRFPQAAVPRSQLDFGYPEVMTYAVQEVRNAMHAALLDAIGGRSSVEGALERAQLHAGESIATELRARPGTVERTP